MQPKFAVGEVVILQSLSHPELSGECTVLQVIKGSFTGETTGAYSPYAYLITIASPTCKAWVESALRKKHQPGELGFKDLMASLSSPKLLKHQPSGAVPL